MEWTDIGIVLGTRRHGEANAILELMTREHGRHLGLVRGGAGSRLKPVLQAGNTVSATWRARLDEHLGHFVVEGIDLRAAALLPAAHAVYGVTHLAALCRLLPERDPHAVVYEAFDAAVDRLGDPAAVAVRIARFELQLLAELGSCFDVASVSETEAALAGTRATPRAQSRNATTVSVPSISPAEWKNDLRPRAPSASSFRCAAMIARPRNEAPVQTNEARRTAAHIALPGEASAKPTGTAA